MLSSSSPQPDSASKFKDFCAKHAKLKDKTHTLVSAARAYSMALKDTKAKEESLCLAFAELYNAGVENELESLGADLSKMHHENKRHRRTQDLMKRFATTPFGAGSDTTSAADFAQNLLDGLASGVTAPLVSYQRELATLNTLIEGYEAKSAKYNHYVTKLTTLSQRAAAEEDGMEAAKISAKLARNMEKLKVATHLNDESLEVVCGELSAATSIKGIQGRVDPILDRLVQFFGLLDGSHMDNVMAHQQQFGRTTGILGNAENDDSGSDTDSETDDEVYAQEDIDTEEEEEGFEIQHTHRNYLRKFKPRFKSLTRYMPREKPKHFEGILSVRQEKKLLSSRNFCILKGDVLEAYNNETEPLFGVPPLFEILVKNATEWEQRAPHGFIIEDGYQNKRFFLKSDEDGEKWLKACLRASCWDEGRSRMNILNTLKKIKKISEAGMPSKGGGGGGGSALPVKRGNSKGARVLRTRSSAPQLLKGRAASGGGKKKRSPSYAKVPSLAIKPVSSPQAPLPRRRPSYNPFGSKDGSDPAVPTKRQFAGGSLLFAEETPRPHPNPFQDDDEEDVMESTDDESNLPEAPKLNPFRSSYEESDGRSDSIMEDTREFSMIDDFIALSENGTVSFESFMSWDEMKTAVDSGEITKDEISVQWLEMEGGKGGGLSQEQFEALVRKLERILEH